jgi:hypothetical protein
MRERTTFILTEARRLLNFGEGNTSVAAEDAVLPTRMVGLDQPLER